MIEDGVEGLGKIGTEEAIATLQDLLLSPKMRSHWSHESTTLVEDPEERWAIPDDYWAIRIQGALLSGGAADETLRRLTANLTSREIGLRLLSVDAAGRWQDRPAATELLKRAQQDDDPQVRREASWYLARSGDPAAWRALIESDVHRPSGFVGLAQDAARRFGEMTLEPLQEQPLIDAARSLLRPLLRSSDPSLRVRAVNLTRRLPRGWISDARRAEALALGESMLESDDVASRRYAVRSIAAFAPDGEGRLKALLLGFADKDVREEARSVVGDKAFPAMSMELQRALESGDPDLAKTPMMPTATSVSDGGHLWRAIWNRASRLHTGVSCCSQRHRWPPSISGWRCSLAAKPARPSFHIEGLSHLRAATERSPLASCSTEHSAISRS